MPRILPVPRHVIRKFDEVARRHRLAAVTLTPFISEIQKNSSRFLHSCDNLILFKPAVRLYMTRNGRCISIENY